MEGDYEYFENNPFEQSWMNYEYRIDVVLQLDSRHDDHEDDEDDSTDEPDIPQNKAGQDYTIILNLLHMTILFREQKVLKCLLKKEISIENWKTQVRVKGPNLDDVAEEDHWIIKATCVHLAAKFNSKGLHYLLSGLNAQEFLKSKTISPIHVAATNFDSMSIR